LTSSTELLWKRTRNTTSTPTCLEHELTETALLLMLLGARRWSKTGRPLCHQDTFEALELVASHVTADDVEETGNLWADILRYGDANVRDLACEIRFACLREVLCVRHRLSQAEHRHLLGPPNNALAVGMHLLMTDGVSDVFLSFL